VNAWAFFSQVRRAAKELKLINAKIEHYQDLGFSMGGVAGVIGNKQRGSSRVEMAAIGAVDALRDLQKEQAYYLGIVARAEQIIRNIDSEKHRQILTYLYIIGKSPSWVSDELEYNDPNSIYRAKKQALIKAQRIMNAQEERNADHS
jgi:hypothetical protein